VKVFLGELEVIGHVPRDGFSFAVRVGGQIDGGGVGGGGLEFVKHLLLATDDHILGLEVVLDFDAHLGRGQVYDVPDRREDFVVLAEVTLDRLGLGGRLDDDQVAPEALTALAWARVVLGAEAISTTSSSEDLVRRTATFGLAALAAVLTVRLRRLGSFGGFGGGGVVVIVSRL
jgi:hypothetical protein